MLRWLSYVAIGLLILCVGAVWFVFFSPRPELTIDPHVLAGDGSTVNYCVLSPLDGSGKRAQDIAKGNTPGCLYTHFPLPLLAECTEPLTEGADDLRGLWQSDDGRHVERIEQCGSRVVITTSGVIHDSGPNATAGLTTNDTFGPLFSVAGRPLCPRTSALMVWNEGVLDFHAFGFGPVVVRRYRDGEQVVWEYLNGRVTRMNRICAVPETHRYPNR